MRVLIIGATGTIGKAVADAAEREHEVLRASRNGDISVDIADETSIRKMYAGLQGLDAVISCAGTGAFKPLLELTNEEIDLTLGNKLMGQVNLVRYGVDSMNDGGVFLLTAGIFGTRPIPGVPALAMVNAALEGFARGAALDLPRGIRINTLSPPFIKETAEAMGMEGGLPAAENARIYLSYLTGSTTGQVIFTGEP